MPQLDQATFCLQSLLTIMSLFGLYILFTYYLLPEISLALRLRYLYIHFLNSEVLFLTYIVRRLLNFYNFTTLTYLSFLNYQFDYFKSKLKRILMYELYFIEQISFFDFMQNYSYKCLFLYKFYDFNINKFSKKNNILFSEISEISCQTF